MKKYILIIIFVIVTISVKANADSLLNVYKQTYDKNKKITLLIKIAESYKTDSLNLAIKYAKQACGISNAKDTKKAEALMFLGELYKNKKQFYLAIKQINKAKKLYANKKDIEKIDYSNYELAKIYLKLEKNDSVIKCIDSVTLNNNYKNYDWAFSLLQIKGKGYFQISDFETSINAYKESLDFAKNDSISQANTYNKICNIKRRMGKYKQAISYAQKALDIQKKINDTIGIADSYYGLGSIYYFNENNKLAIKYFKKSLNIYENNNNLTEIARLNANIGSVYNEMKEYKKASNYFLKAYKVFEKLNNNYVLAIILDNLGLTYQGLKNYEKAEIYFKKSYNQQKKIGNKEGMVKAMINIAGLNKFKGNKTLAYEKYLQILKQAKELKMLNDQMVIYKEITELESDLGLHKKALESYKNYVNIKDSLFTKENNEQLDKLQSEIELKEHQAKIKILKANNELKESKLKRQKQFTITTSIIAFLMLISLVIVYFALRINKKAKEQLQEKNEEISLKNTNITDSINYAKRVHEALFKSSENIDEIFENNFIINKAKNILSGDFWWLQTIKNKQYLIVSDCTGHGVPGAFMSVLGVTLIQHILKDNDNLSANQILDKLRISIKHALGQESIYDNFDGMDLTVCIIDKQNMTLEFSGSYNYAYILRNNNIIELKGDKMPISFSLTEKPFGKQEIVIKPKDRIFMLTDGYYDQHKDDVKKITRKRFKHLLIESSELNLIEQGNFLENFFDKWKGNSEQTDDMLTVGIEI